VNAVYVVWVIEDACPNCKGSITEIGLEDGLDPGMPLVQLVGLVAARPGRG
jgi:hypothetical protein